MDNTFEQQKQRLLNAHIYLQDDELITYYASPDQLPLTENVPVGYKKCGGCKSLKKLYMFNCNKDSKLNCSGNCKECQKVAASKSYIKTKDTRDYKAYYLANRDMKREHNKQYYQTHKDIILSKHHEYRQTTEGRQAMNQAHSLRKKSMKKNTGVPYTRELVIERDSIFLGNDKPICCLCGKLIELTDVHMEHLMPIALNGIDCFTNVGCAHSECNLRKSKDAHEITSEQVAILEERAVKFIDTYPDKFKNFG